MWQKQFFTLALLIALFSGSNSLLAQSSNRYPKVPVLQQKSLPPLPAQLRRQEATKSRPLTGFEKRDISIPASASMLRGPLEEEVMGSTYYDLQTNGSASARMQVWANGEVSGAWTQSKEPETDPQTYTDRGSVVNTRSNWLAGNYPAARLESTRSGFTNYVVTSDNTELVFSHVGAGKLNELRRPSGATNWTQSTVPSAIPNNLLWCKAAVDGNNVHVIALTTPASGSLGGSLYRGMDGHVLYWRSQDAGATWDIQDGIITGLDSTFFAAISADAYSIDARGGRVVVGVFDSFNDTRLFTSEDNGTTWAPLITLVDFPLDKYKIDQGYTIDDLGGGDPNAPTPMSMFTSDGSGVVHIDLIGYIHCVFPAMYVKDTILTDGNSQYFPGTNGLDYWSEYKPENLFLISFAKDWDSSGVLEFTAVEGYGGFGLSSMPTIASSETGELGIVFTAGVENLVDQNTNSNYRHAYMIRSADIGDTWSEPTDLQYASVDSLIGGLSEAVFPSAYKNIVNGNMYFQMQRDYTTGAAVQKTGAQIDEISDIIYMSSPVTVTKDPAIVPLELSLVPNPADEQVLLSFQLTQQAPTSVEVLNLDGRMLSRQTMGAAKGPRTQTLDTHSLPNGLYIVRVQAGQQSGVKRLVVQHR